MAQHIWLMLKILLLVLLFAAVYVSIHSLLHGLRRERRGLPFMRIRMMLERERRYRWFRSWFLVPREPSIMAEIQGLLEASGLKIDALDYTASKRLLGFMFSLLLSLSYIAWKLELMPGDQLLWATGICVMVIALLLNDKIILRMIREQRRARIVRDVQIVSSQLLYYRHSRMNVHSQLQRCVPLALFIRKELQLLVNEWYEGSSEALQKFRRRLATDEADDFAETLNALRMYGSERYYDLLEERIRSYKEKLSLIREGRKEAASYILFLISGIPIMYTFLIFIYPWVAESRVLFDALG